MSDLRIAVAFVATMASLSAIDAAIGAWDGLAVLWLTFAIAALPAIAYVLAASAWDKARARRRDARGL